MKELCENLDDLISQNPTLILQFGEDVCGACHAIRFKLDKWLEGKHVEARYIDISSHLELCSQMGILSAPAVMVYMDGKMVAKEAGYFSLDEMLGSVERYMELRQEAKESNKS